MPDVQVRQLGEQLEAEKAKLAEEVGGAAAAGPCNAVRRMMAA